MSYDGLPAPALLRRVLIADNDAIIRNLLRALLAKLGQSVVHVGTTDEALRQALAARFSLVILDLDMAPDGGLHVCRRLRTDPAYAAAYADVPVMILTALDNAEARERSREAGATGFIAKPFNPAELIRRLLPHLHVAEADQSRLAELLNGDRGLRFRDAEAARADARLELL